MTSPRTSAEADAAQASSQKVTQPPTHSRGTEAAPLAAALPSEQPVESCPQLELTKLFTRCGPRARREFLQDARMADPQLFREITEGRTT
jgi:hypothetical protein